MLPFLLGLAIAFVLFVALPIGVLTLLGARAQTFDQPRDDLPQQDWICDDGRLAEIDVTIDETPDHKGEA